MSILKFKKTKQNLPQVKKLSKKELTGVIGGTSSTTLSDATPVRAVMNG